MSFDPCEELDALAAHSLIRDIVVSGEVIISKHAKDRMKQRGYSAHDVEYILLNGKVVGKDFKETTRQWAYTVTGDDLEGDSGSVVVVVIRRSAGVVVTVLS